MSLPPDTVGAADSALVVGVPADERRPRDWLSPVRDTFSITWRNLIGIRRVPQLMVFTLIQPVIFVLLFTYVFGGAIKGLPPGGHLRRLPDSRRIRADRRFRLDHHRGGDGDRLEERDHRAIPLASDVALGRPSDAR